MSDWKNQTCYNDERVADAFVYCLYKLNLSEFRGIWSVWLPYTVYIDGEDYIANARINSRSYEE